MACDESTAFGHSSMPSAACGEKSKMLNLQKCSTYIRVWYTRHPHRPASPHLHASYSATAYRPTQPPPTSTRRLRPLPAAPPRSGSPHLTWPAPSDRISPASYDEHLPAHPHTPPVFWYPRHHRHRRLICIRVYGPTLSLITLTLSPSFTRRPPRRWTRCSPPHRPPRRSLGGRPAMASKAAQG